MMAVSMFAEHEVFGTPMIRLLISTAPDSASLVRLGPGVLEGAYDALGDRVLDAVGEAGLESAAALALRRSIARESLKYPYPH